MSPIVTTHSIINRADVPRFKRYLKAGKLHCIGTTTPRHYDEITKLYGSSDYLSDIQVDEPSVPETVNILRTLTDSLTVYHGGGFGVEDAALYQAVNMAKRFLASIVGLPKSAVQILDQACALVRNQRSQAFESWEYAQCRKVVLQVEIAALKVRISAVALTILQLYA
jgi:ATP-dependent Clp protease ATP-binding subunit ClpB